MTNHIHLYVIETTVERAERLAVELAPLPQVTVLQSYLDAVAVSGGLDAIVVPLMSAIEWGSIKLPAPIHQTRVVKTPDYEVARGRPNYAIPGVATVPGESLDPMDCTRLVLRESFHAIHLFNQTNKIKLAKIGAPSLSLGLNKLKAGEALALLSEAYLESVS